jgi:predicted Zn-dependent protease
VIVRIVVALAAVWLVISIANVHQERNALAKLTRDPASARSEAQAARTLNPDRYPLVLQGASYLFAGDRAAAARIFQRVLRDEPDNVRVWALLYQATKSPQAAAAIRRLSPLR